MTEVPCIASSAAPTVHALAILGPRAIIGDWPVRGESLTRLNPAGGDEKHRLYASCSSELILFTHDFKQSRTRLSNPKACPLNYTRQTLAACGGVEVRGPPIESPLGTISSLVSVFEQ
jgi:hypothetical protein